MRIRYENLDKISKQLEIFKEKGFDPEGWYPYLLASIAVSLAQIADVLIAKVESEDNGKPLDKVLEDIKAEITERWEMYEDRFDVSDCLDIIDKHISRKEIK